MQGSLTNVTTITSCYIGPAISPEHFIPEHFFLYLAKGKIEGYDGHTHYTLRAGEYCVVRKNHLARYSKEKDNEQFEKVVVVFDEAFLKARREKYSTAAASAVPKSAFVRLPQNELIPNFVRSLMPYYNGTGEIDETFSDVKREELLLILLQSSPALAGIFFDFGIPAKIDLEAFMNRNYKFNVGIERFAYLTGRSLSAFKRDFAKIFSDTPSRWLVKKRLQEAYYLIGKKGEKPSDIYLELGFEDLSHFSFAFKRAFGVSPTALRQK